MSSTNAEPSGRDGEGGARYRPQEETERMFPRDRTALLVIDPVNDFLSKRAADWESTKTTVRMHDVIAHLKHAIAGARERGISVLFGPTAYTAEDYTDKNLHRRSGITRIMFEKKMFLDGSWGPTFTPTCSPSAVIPSSCRTKASMSSRPTFLSTSSVSALRIW